MSPQFKAGVRQFFEIAYANAPVIVGAASGAVGGRLVSSRDQDLALPGAIAGAGLGTLRLPRWRRHLAHGLAS